MADRSIPENTTDPSEIRTPKPVKKPTFPNGLANKARNQARQAALKARITQAKEGTAHEQHLAHMQHVANVKNNPKKYG